MTYEQLVEESRQRVVQWDEVPESCQFTPERARQLYAHLPHDIANQYVSDATRNFELRTGKCVAVIMGKMALWQMKWVEPCRHPARHGYKYCGYHLRKECHHLESNP